MFSPVGEAAAESAALTQLKVPAHLPYAGRRRHGVRIEVVRELTIAEPTKAVHDIFALVAAADVVSSGVEGGRVAAAQGTTLTLKGGG